MRHNHACPRCYEYEKCLDGCSIEPDLGEHNGLPLGDHTLCSRCELEMNELMKAIDQGSCLETLQAAIDLIEGHPTIDPARVLRGALENERKRRAEVEREVYFFGCWNDKMGHFVYDPRGWDIRDAGPFRGSNLDGVYPPQGLSKDLDAHACLHHIEGWTVLAFWDRTVDHRGASNAAFIIEGEFSFRDAERIAAEKFPQLWPRFKGRLRLVKE